MDVRLFLRIALCSGLLLSGSCGKEDPGPARPGNTHNDDDDDDDDEEEEGARGKKDAGKKDAGKKDAGKKDAGKDAGRKGSASDDEETEDEDEEASEDEEEEPVRDAGRGTTTAPKDSGSGGGGTTAPKDSGTTTPPPEEGGGSASGPTVPTEPTGNDPTCTPVTYDGFTKAFVSKYCGTCHGAAAPIPLAQEAQLAALGIKITDRVTLTLINNRPMPPMGAPQPSEAERSQFLDWVACKQ